MADFFHANINNTTKIERVKVDKWNETSVWVPEGGGKPRRKLRVSDKDFYSEDYHKAREWLVAYWRHRHQCALQLTEVYKERLNEAIMKT